jgi:hypothetical protein
MLLMTMVFMVWGHVGSSVYGHRRVYTASKSHRHPHRCVNLKPQPDIYVNTCDR